MSYVAIARKWRPTRFEDIAGQTHVTRTLRNAISLGRIHHAFLFTGARGVGKTTAARVMARALNCEQGPTADPCGECASCREILAGASPDVIEIDGASNNSVEDIRDLRETVRYLPQRGRSKVYIVDEVHMLSKGAFNALLKTLEEPPPHVVFIFATTEPQKIPDTILSRVQRFDFKRIPLTVVVDCLRAICDKESIRVDDGGLRMIARAGEGSMRDAQTLLDRVLSMGDGEIKAEQVAEVLGLVDRRLLYEMLQGMLQGEPDRCLETIEAVYGYGYDLSEFTAELLELLRNATLVGLSPGSKRYLDVPDEERERLEGLAKGVSPDVFVRSFQVMIEVHEQVARAPRPRMVLEMAVARLTAVRPSRPLDQIVDRLGDMERRLRHGGVVARPRGQAGGGQPRAGGAGGGDEDGEPHPRPAPAAAPRGPAPTPRGPVPTPPPRPPAQGASPMRLEPGRRPAPPPIDDRFDAPPPEASPGFDVDEPPAVDVLAEVPPPPEEYAEEEQAPVELVLPLVPRDADGPTRFRLFQEWLEKGGHRYLLWARDGVFVAEAPPQLQLWFATPFSKTNAEHYRDDPRVRAGLAAFFPGCPGLQLGLRPPGSKVESRKERLDRERLERIEGLRAEVEGAPIIIRLRQILGAEITAICPADETPAALRALGGN